MDYFFYLKINILRLRKKNITCLHPSKINTVGKINMIAFDKTGTLTQDSLKLSGYLQFRNLKFEDKILTNINETTENVLLSLSSCHSVKKIDEIILGEILDSFWTLIKILCR